MNRQERLFDVLAAIERGDETYTLSNDVIEFTFPLPSPQRSGTNTQNNAYNRMKAQEIVETYIK